MYSVSRGSRGTGAALDITTDINIVRTNNGTLS
jgi:hypothetical protein